MPYPILPTPFGGSAFNYPDPEGAPANDGRRYHSALDWFADGGTHVKSPVNGTVVEARPSRGDSGQVFGGTVKIREGGTGRVYAMRHVDRQTVRVGEKVRAGQVVARVVNWRDGSDHVHLEIWKSLAGGYDHENMIDPVTLSWDTKVPAEENLAEKSYLRIVIDGGRVDVVGWDQAKPVLTWIAKNGLKTDQVAIAWRGPGQTTTNVWRGARDVTAVARSIYNRYVL